MSAQPVCSSLAPNPPADTGSAPRPARGTRRRRRDVENLDFAAFATRIIRAHGRRIADGESRPLPDLLDLADESLARIVAWSNV
jgi:hypothetical protein